MISGVACEDIFHEDRAGFHISQYWMVPPRFDDSGATRFLNVAAVSFDVNPSPEVNRERIVYFIDKIVLEQPTVRLILFPEMTLGYYYRPSNPKEYQRSIAETVPGTTTDIISEKAIEHGIYISFGMGVKCDEDFYVSQILIGPDGAIESVYRKFYLTSWDKEMGFKAGHDIIINIIDNIRVATIICNDINSLTLARKIHESGADLVLFPEATVGTVGSFFRRPLPFFQLTYTWFLRANRVGKEDGNFYDGQLSLVTPSGEPRIIMEGREGYIFGVVKCW
jgi:predicted amidohydrolase